jgi:hypothetical protein
MIARACAVCSGVALAGWAPAVIGRYAVFVEFVEV